MLICHSFIAGTTQSGKSELAKARAKQFKGGVFFFNPQDIDAPKGFIKVTGQDCIQDITRLLDKGEKFNFVPHHNDKMAKKELEYIARYVFENRVKTKNTMPISFIADECHVYIKNNTDSNVINLATRGLRWKIYLTSITQRPALTNNTLFTQSELKTYLHIEEEDVKYFKSQGIPMEQVQAELKSAGKFHYIDKHVSFNDGFKDGYSKARIEKLV